MAGEGEGWGGWAPPPLYLPKDDHWTHFDNSVNAVSFGFIATAILISMFLVMAIFEKFLKTTSPELLPSHRRRSSVEAHNHVAAFNPKLGHYSSPKIRCRPCGGRASRQGSEPPRAGRRGGRKSGSGWYNFPSFSHAKATEVSVVMPGEKVPTFIAHPAPVPCPPERGPWPLHNPDVL